MEQLAKSPIWPRAVSYTHLDVYKRQEQDGLHQPWDGIVWCNPPYGREIGKWVQKAYDENRRENNYIVMLLPARTDTKWFHDYILGKAEVRFVRGRLKFGGSKNSAPFPSMVVVFRPKMEMLEGME